MGRHTGEKQDREKVERALKLADMYEEIAGQPLKEKTILTREFSKEGVVFSGGQNQKILAARAFAKDSPLRCLTNRAARSTPLRSTIYLKI